MKGYVPVVQVVLHGVFSRHGHGTNACVESLTLIWNMARRFLETFCDNNEQNKRVVLPAVSLLMRGVNMKFPGYKTIIRVSPLLLLLLSIFRWYSQIFYL